MRIAAVTCVKNEGPFLLEWIAYHRLIGVTDFLFYSNDCTDGTDDMLDALADQGIVVHLDNPARGRNYQMEALKDAARQPVVKNANWVWIADVDEYLNVRVGDRDIPSLIKACGDPHAISVTFQYFANGGIEHFEDRPVVEQFTKTHNPDVWTDQTAQEVKTLVRRDFPLKYFGAHRPFASENTSDRDPIRWTDGAGRSVPKPFLDAATKSRLRKFPARGARTYATLHHYALRSLESFLVKSDRGDVNRANRQFDISYWTDRNDTAIEDRAMLAFLPAINTAVDALKALPRIGGLHADCVARHRAHIRNLRSDPEVEATARALKAAPALPEAERALIALLGEMP